MENETLLVSVFKETLRGLIYSHVNLADSRQIDNEVLLRVHHQIIALLNSAPKGYDFSWTIESLYRNARSPHAV